MSQQLSQSTYFPQKEQLSPEITYRRGIWRELDRPFPELLTEAESRRAYWYSEVTEPISPTVDIIDTLISLGDNLDRFLDPFIRYVTKIETHTSARLIGLSRLTT